LDRGSAEELLDNLFRGGDLPHATRSLIEERTGGNPFFIEEVVRSLIEEEAVEFRDGALWTTDKIDSVQIPSSVREVIMARIDRLPVPIKRVLQAAAIIGRTAYTRVLARILEGDELEESLEVLTDGQLLVRRERLGESVYEFTHPLIQEVAYEAVSLERREEYHRRIACAIEELFSENHPGYFGMLAYHFSLGRDLERAEEYLFLACDQASRLAASSEALPLLQQAARLYFEIHGEAGDPKKKALLEKKIAMAFFARGRMVEGDEHFNRALALLGQSVPRAEISRKLRFAMSFAAVLGDLYLARASRRRRIPTDQDREVIAMTFARAQAETTADPSHFLVDSMEGLRRLNRFDPRSVERAGGQYATAVALFVYSGLSYGIGKRFLARAESLVNRDDAHEAFLYDLMDFLYHLFRGDWDDRGLGRSPHGRQGAHRRESPTRRALERDQLPATGRKTQGASGAIRRGGGRSRVDHEDG
jgi:hypothetical protein